MGLLKKREVISYAAGLVAQVVAVVLFATRAIGDVSAVAASALGVIGALICASVILPRPRPLTLVGFIAALIAGVGWGSWLYVMARYEQTDAVINITGMAVVPGMLVGLLVLAIGAFRRRPTRTYSLVFAALLAATGLVFLNGDQLFGNSGWYLPVVLVGVMLSAALVIIAAVSTAPTAVRIIAAVSGAAGVIGPLMLFVPGVAIAGVGALIAGLVDVAQRRGTAWPSLSFRARKRP